MLQDMLVAREASVVPLLAPLHMLKRDMPTYVAAKITSTRFAATVLPLGRQGREGGKRIGEDAETAEEPICFEAVVDIPTLLGTHTSLHTYGWPWGRLHSCGARSQLPLFTAFELERAVLCVFMLGTRPTRSNHLPDAQRSGMRRTGYVLKAFDGG